MAITTKQFWFGLLLLAAGALPQAWAAGIFLCVDPNGRRELTDVNKPGCKEINVPGAIAAPAGRPGVPNPPGRAGGGSAAAAASQASFPKVDSAQQKARDKDRKEILNDELRNEQRKLAELRSEYKNGEPERRGDERNYAKYQERVGQMRDNISRAEKNIEALRRELGTIK